MSDDPYTQLEQSMGTMADVEALFPEDVAWLLERFYGKTLVATAAGLENVRETATDVQRWAALDDYAGPDAEQLARMRAMLRVWFIVAPAVGRSMAMGWFAGFIAGSYLDEDGNDTPSSPAGLCRDGRFDELLQRAKIFRYRVETDAFS